MGAMNRGSALAQMITRTDTRIDAAGVEQTPAVSAYGAKRGVWAWTATRIGERRPSGMARVRFNMDPGVE
ncbi:hypothetical protein ON010_g12558 [Phytophthora cinnamomi]|nr:hypothetical protein ON010_g12558 [Phytophthora cinnamomi]